jgi:hypothetical protein
MEQKSHRDLFHTCPHNDKETDFADKNIFSDLGLSSLDVKPPLSLFNSVSSQDFYSETATGCIYQWSKKDNFKYLNLINQNGTKEEE